MCDRGEVGVGAVCVCVGGEGGGGGEQWNIILYYSAGFL